MAAGCRDGRRRRTSPGTDGRDRAPEVCMDAIEIIMQEHREAERLFAQLHGRRDEELVERLTELLTAHTEAEERVLYPAVVDLVDGGQKLVQEAIEEHRQAEHLLAAIEAAEPGSADVQQLVGQLEQAVTHHVQEEESEVLPRLRERASDDVLDTLGRALVAVRSEASGDADVDAGTAADRGAAAGR
jgi:hemerythrin superfamily protein